MKTKIFTGIITFVLVWLAALSFSGCSKEQNPTRDNNGSLGTLSYTWSNTAIGDTTFLVCAQTLRFSDKNGVHTYSPEAKVKLYPKIPVVEYASTDNPEPVYLRSAINSGYEGTNPRYRIIYQEIYLDDGETLIAEITTPLYSYMNSGRELFHPHVELNSLVFANVTLDEENDVFYPTLSFSVAWSVSDNSAKGKKYISVSYAKKTVSTADKLIKTTYDQGIDWLSSSTFSLYVEKTDYWQNAGAKKSKNSSPTLNFEITASNHRSLDVTDFDFTGKLNSPSIVKTDISQNGWTLKQGTAKKTVSFTNGKESFEDNFSYPVYDASLTWNGKTFDFDLSVDFRESHNIAILSDTKGKNTTVCTVTFAKQSFEKTIVTSMTKKSTPPDVSSKYGKVLSWKVTAVFDTEAIKKKEKITKKCVLVRYEKGYEWGICAYDDAFPSTFTYTATTFNGFDSAAKKDGETSFQLARTVQSDADIRWYDEHNNQISGIDALTCKFKGWANMVDGVYASEIIGYSATSSSDYSLTLKAPNGQTKTFSSN